MWENIIITSTIVIVSLFFIKALTFIVLGISYLVMCIVAKQSENKYGWFIFVIFFWYVVLTLVNFINK